MANLTIKISDLKQWEELLSSIREVCETTSDRNAKEALIDAVERFVKSSN